MNIFEFDHLEQLTEAIEEEHNEAVKTFNDSFEYASQAPPGEESHILAALAGLVIGASVIFDDKSMQHFWYMYENYVSLNRDQIEHDRESRQIAADLYEIAGGQAIELPPLDIDMNRPRHEVVRDLAEGLMNTLAELGIAITSDDEEDDHIPSLEELLNREVPDDLSGLDGDNPGGYL